MSRRNPRFPTGQRQGWVLLNNTGQDASQCINTPFRAPALRRCGAPLPGSRVALCHLEAKGVIAGAQAHAQVRGNKVVIDFVVTQPVTAEPAQAIEHGIVLEAVCRFAIQRQTNSLSRLVIEKARDDFVVMIIRGFGHDAPQQNIKGGWR